MYDYWLALQHVLYHPLLFPLSWNRREIAGIELSVQRLVSYHKVNGIYAPDARIRKDGVIRKLVKEGIEALSPAEVSVAWITVEDSLRAIALWGA